MVTIHRTTEASSNTGVLQVRGWALGVVLGLAAGVCFALESGHVDRSPAVLLEEKINPNTAPIASLIRLPRIGVARAQAIVAHRQHRPDGPGGRTAFNRPDDLTEVSGIGPRTVDDVAAWLEFDGSERARPARR